MSTDEAPPGSAPPDGDPGADGEQKKQDEAANEASERQRQEAWTARKALIAHGPAFVRRIAGSGTLNARDQYGVSGGFVQGNVNFYGGPAPRHEQRSGTIPRERVALLSGVFCDCPSFDEALARLRSDRVVVLSGGRRTGRRAAGLMLLSRLGVEQMRSVGTPPSVWSLTEQLDDACGYLLSNLPLSRSNPLNEPQLLHLTEQLKRTGGHLVITVEPSAALTDIPYIRWEPPSGEEMLRAHVTPHTGAAAWAELCGTPAVTEFLSRPQQPSEIEGYARQLVDFHRGDIDAEKLSAYGSAAVEAQVSRMLTDDAQDLRDRAFLISLAVFDQAPYAVAAELGDLLYVLLQKKANPREVPVIPVFGAAREQRLRLAGAKGYVDTEVTDWGSVVGQFFAAYQDEHTAPALLDYVWIGQPSARSALVDWIDTLADDRRPLVRTRAASAAARLALGDLSSAMALLIEPWADDGHFDSWLTAANALTMAHLLDVRNVPQILRAWCTGESDSRRWTAIRAYGLLGPMHYKESLAALLDAMQRQATADRGADEDDYDDEESEADKQFADALEILLLAVGTPVLGTLAELLGKDRAVRAHALRAFRQVCAQSTDDGHDRPVVLDWYARATAVGTTATTSDLTVFWLALLADRTHNRQALGILRGWIRGANSDPEAESALGSLLAALVTTSANRRRISHLLRTVRDSDSGPVPVAHRLLQRLSLS
ncbi:hypothetical protein ACN2WE_24320 [Streptomyces sp. cg28]|uniref:hypothetical protein n=1 Tax=Streptomyces sp. cg28 TaxID=3403457 RepID=UPI003B20C2EC